MRRAFTIIELLVAIGILAIVLSFSGAIFHASTEAHRTALANAEIMQKLRTVTEQLNADFKGLRKDGEIFAVWTTAPTGTDGAYERFDRIMFFAEGDFQSYGDAPSVRGNLARICYLLGHQEGQAVQNQPERTRTLARTQHIMTSQTGLATFLDPNSFTDEDWFIWNNRYEYDKMSLQQWLNIPVSAKQDMLTAISSVRIQMEGTGSNIDKNYRGVTIEPSDPNTLHMLLCQGVGEFKIQGWSDTYQRWIPEVDPDGNGDYSDTDFFDLTTEPSAGSEVESPGLLYPYGLVKIRNITYPRDAINEDHFNEIPGFGRALKFTFTLYDSKGILKEGRTFTHIVYLDN